MTGIKETVEGQNQDVDTTIDTTVDTTVDTGIDTDAGVKGLKKSGDDLDTRLDRLMGTGKQDVKATTTDPKAKVLADTTVDPATGKPKVAAEATGRFDNTNRQRVNPAHTPRAYGKAFKWDTQGNVVRSDTGELVAAVGGQRTAFEKMLPLITTAQIEADKYKGMYESAAASNVVATKLGLTPEEYSIGARVMAAFKSDPKKAIAFMVKEAQDNGVDVSDLGFAGGGVTRKDIEDVVKGIVQESLKPFSFITADREATERDNALRSEADDTISEFFTAQPDAVLHESSLAGIMNAKPGTSLETAYFILKSHALEHGFDFKKPLGPQAAAWRAKNGGTAKGTDTNIPQRRLPDMSGRQDNGNIVERKSSSLSGETNTGDIVRDAMREAGMDISNL